MKIDLTEQELPMLIHGLSEGLRASTFSDDERSVLRALLKRLAALAKGESHADE